MKKEKQILIISLAALMILSLHFLFDGKGFLLSDVQADTATTTVTVQNVAPVVSNCSVNGGTDPIVLTENTTTTVTVACTITDDNGYADVDSATATLCYAASGSTCANYGCAPDDNTCYQLDTTDCVLGLGSGNVVYATCTADVWFHANPTDASTTDGEIWVGRMRAYDGVDYSLGATNTAENIDMQTLLALIVTDAINYGALNPGYTPTALEQLTTATTTGNAAIDVELSGTDMTYGAETITIDNQRYGTSTAVAWADATIASSTPVAHELISVKPTTHPSNAADNVAWGLAVPTGQVAGDYEGVNTYSAIAD